MDALRDRYPHRHPCSSSVLFVCVAFCSCFLPTAYCLLPTAFHAAFFFFSDSILFARTLLSEVVFRFVFTKCNFGLCPVAFFSTNSITRSRYSSLNSFGLNSPFSNSTNCFALLNSFFSVVLPPG